MPLVPTNEEIEEKARELADQERIGRGAVVSEEGTGQGHRGEAVLAEASRRRSEGRAAERSLRVAAIAID